MNLFSRMTSQGLWSHEGEYSLEQPQSSSYQASPVDDDTSDVLDEGWEIIEPMNPSVQQSVRLEGLGIYHADTEDQKTNATSKRQAFSDRGQKSHATTRSDTFLADDVDTYWEFVPREPDWDIINRKEQREARRATKPEPIADDWVVCDMGKDGEVEMFEGVRAESESQHEHDYAPLLDSVTTVESCGDSVPADILSEESDEDAQLTNIPLAPTTLQEPPKDADERQLSRSRDRVKSTLQPNAPPYIPMRCRISTSRAKKHNPNKQQPLSAEEQVLPGANPPRKKPVLISKPMQRPSVAENVLSAATADQQNPHDLPAASTSNGADKWLNERIARARQERYASYWYGASFGPGDTFEHYRGP